eukprot:TRINITY_DN7766_c0_g3_i1.p1 TRINITY_DN7766_c0_g3~~TRINITY_DN7766_c0_g3_i1.p1  ORF type:complete len:194 (+),score=23.25 TRINITY_DN7766_c0_g3_i1:183-764(+)
MLGAPLSDRQRILQLAVSHQLSYPQRRRMRSMYSESARQGSGLELEVQTQQEELALLMASQFAPVHHTGHRRRLPHPPSLTDYSVHARDAALQAGPRADRRGDAATATALTAATVAAFDAATLARGSGGASPLKFASTALDATWPRSAQVRACAPEPAGRQLQVAVAGGKGPAARSLVCHRCLRLQSSLQSCL